MKKLLVKITSVILLIFFLYLIAEKGLSELTPERIYYGETQDWQDLQNWTDYLFSASQDQDYAYAFAWVDDENADFIWEYYDERESLVEDLLAKKESTLQKEKKGTVWCFVKLRLSEDIHGTDIYEYMEQNLSEEGDEYSVYTFAQKKLPGNVRDDSYYIEQNHFAGDDNLLPDFSGYG